MSMKPRVEMKVIELLARSNTPMTKHELAALAYCDPRTAHVALKKLRTKRNDIRIAEWRRIAHTFMPAYEMREGGDARKPKPKTASERGKTYRANNPDKVLDSIIKRRLERLKKKLGIKPPELVEKTPELVEKTPELVC